MAIPKMPSTKFFGDQLKILCIAPSLPFPITGGRAHTYNVLKHLSNSNTVGLVANEDKELDLDLKQTYPLNFLNFIYSSKIRYTSSILEKVLSTLGLWMEFRRYYTIEHKKYISTSIINDEYDVILVEELCELAPTLKAVKTAYLSKRPLIVCVAHNDEVLLTKSKGNNKNFFKKIIYTLASLSIQKYQHFWLSQADIIITLTENDYHSLLNSIKKDSKFCYKFGNGIDTQIFQPPMDEVITVQNQVKYLFFMGDLSYPPNKMAVIWFITNVLPYVSYNLIIIGMPSRDKVLLSYLKNPKVQYKGLVKDVRPYIINAWCCLAPIFSGSGSRLKVLEYLSLRKPVISTSLGVQGLKLTDKIHFLLANTAKEFISSISLLESNPA